jgi:hypothetical protein
MAAAGLPEDGDLRLGPGAPSGGQTGPGGVWADSPAGGVGDRRGGS